MGWRYFKYSIGVTLSSVLIWAIVLRLYGITHQSYWIDEGFSITIAQAIAKHGYPLLDSGSVLWRDPAYHYLLAGVVRFFGTGELATRFLSVAFGIGSIVVVTLLAREWFSKRTAAFTLVLMSFSTWEIAWSRQARMYMMFQCVFWLTVFLGTRMYRAYRNRKHHGRVWIAWAVGVILSTTVLVYTHRFGAIIFLTVPFVFVIRKFFQQSEQQKQMQWGMVYIALFVATIVAVLLMVSIKESLPVPVHYGFFYAQFIVRQYTGTCVLAMCGLILGVLNKKHRYRMLWLFTIVMLGFCILSTAVTLLHYRYIFFLYPILLFFAAYALSRISRYQWYGASACILLFIMLNLHGEYTLVPKNSFPLESDSVTTALQYYSFTPQPDFSDAYSFITEQNPEILITPYPVMTRVYRHTDDTFALYTDLIHERPIQPIVPKEEYTNVPFITSAQLQELLSAGHHGIMLVDALALHRIDPDIRKTIEKSMQKIYEKKISDWSFIALYAF